MDFFLLVEIVFLFSCLESAYRRILFFVLSSMLDLIFLSMSMLRVILYTQREVVPLCSAIPNTLHQANHLRPNRLT